ncbi:MAG: hypothetical protein K5900_03090 [Butyrivibrio sp.]|nr:hypothetical protein [Butyrivibrio sp.]
MEGITEKEFAYSLLPKELRNSEYINKLKESRIIEAPDLEVTRSDAARILHLFVKNVLEIRDIEDITPAGVLRDLYDCRVCVNHIAQVYLRGLMQGVRIPDIGTDFEIFDSKGLLSRQEAAVIAEKVWLLKA